MSVINLKPVSLTKANFAPFGDVIETKGANSYAINQGTTKRYHDLAFVDVVEGQGRAMISIFRGQPRVLPYKITMMERHPIASQAFYPLSDQPYLVVVAEAGNDPTPQSLQAFFATRNQGVNYQRGVWHHPLLALYEESDFLIVDRGGAGHNLDEYTFSEGEGYAVIASVSGQ